MHAANPPLYTLVAPGPQIGSLVIVGLLLILGVFSFLVAVAAMSSAYLSAKALWLNGIKTNIIPMLQDGERSLDREGRGQTPQTDKALRLVNRWG